MQGRHSLGSRRLGRIGSEIHFLWFRDRSENCVVSYVASERRGIPGPKIGTSTPQTKTCRYHPKKQRPLLGGAGRLSHGFECATPRRHAARAGVADADADGTLRQDGRTGGRGGLFGVGQRFVRHGADSGGRRRIFGERGESVKRGQECARFSVRRFGAGFSRGNPAP